MVGFCLRGGLVGLLFVTFAIVACVLLLIALLGFCDCLLFILSLLGFVVDLFY